LGISVVAPVGDGGGWEGGRGFLWTPAAVADLRNLYQCLVRLARWRAVKEFRMSDPDRLTSRNDTASALDKQGLILRIIVLLFSPLCSGIRSSLPRYRDTLRDELRA
jgi:hypothetical protein